MHVYYLYFMQMLDTATYHCFCAVVFTYVNTNLAYLTALSADISDLQMLCFHYIFSTTDLMGRTLFVLVHLIVQVTLIHQNVGHMRFYMYKYSLIFTR